MFVYEKKLQYPVRIKNCNPKLAAFIISQYGGPYINRRLFRQIETIENPQGVIGFGEDTAVNGCMCGRVLLLHGRSGVF